MAENKTKPTAQSVQEFLEGVAHEQRRKDSFVVLEIMKEITQEEPTMWGPSIIGFGNYHYKYESGREGDFFLTGFSPRKQSLTLYIMGGFSQYDTLLEQLGKHKHGKSCLYINKLDDIDMDILKEMIQKSVTYISEKYPAQ